MIYIVVCTWDYENTKNILVTHDKKKADDLAATYNRAYGSDTQNYEVEEMELDKVYEIV